MGKYLIVFAQNTIKELQKHKKVGNKVINAKIDKIFNELKNNPFAGEGQPEILRFNLKGFWSRRINREHRIIYRVDEENETVFIVSLMGHYSDK